MPRAGALRTRAHVGSGCTGGRGFGDSFADARAGRAGNERRAGGGSLYFSGSEGARVFRAARVGFNLRDSDQFCAGGAGREDQSADAEGRRGFGNSGRDAVRANFPEKGEGLAESAWRARGYVHLDTRGGAGEGVARAAADFGAVGRGDEGREKTGGGKFDIFCQGEGYSRVEALRAPETPLVCAGVG